MYIAIQHYTVYYDVIYMTIYEYSWNLYKCIILSYIDNNCHINKCINTIQIKK